MNELSFVDNVGQVQTEDTRNIKEEYRWWDHTRIVEHLSSTQSEMLSIFLNLTGDFNISSGIRANLWFNTSGVYIVGSKKWDRRGAVGSHNYLPTTYEPDIASLITYLREEQGYRVVAAEITDDAISLPDYKWSPKSAVIFGEEGCGVSEEVLDACDDVVCIPGNGSVRSLNVSQSAGIFSYDYYAKTCV